MANRAVEMDFSLHLMLSLQCRAPGLLAAEPPSCLFPTHSSVLPPTWKGLQEELSLCDLLLRVGVKGSYPTSYLTREEGKMRAQSCACLG